MKKSNKVSIVDDNIPKTAICDDFILHPPPLTDANDEIGYTYDDITGTATSSMIAQSDTTNERVYSQNEKEDNCLRRTSFDCDSILPRHVIGYTRTLEHLLDKEIDNISDSSEHDEFFRTKKSKCRAVITAGVHLGCQSPSGKLMSPPFNLVDTAVDNISDQIGFQLSMLCSAHTALSDDESNHDGHTVLLSSSSSASVEHVHESPLHTDSFSNGMICRLPVAVMDNGYCSDEICYSVFSDCVDHVDVLSSDVEATLVACGSENIGSSSSTLRAIKQPLLPLENSQMGDSCSLRNESPSGVIISEPKHKDTCLVSQWLSSISDCPHEVPSISEYCAATSELYDVGNASSSSEQLNSSVSANAILLSLGNTLRNMQINLSYCDTDLTGIALNLDEDKNIKPLHGQPTYDTISPKNEVVQMSEPVLACESNLSSETNFASQTLSDRRAEQVPSQNLSIQGSSGALYETAAEEIFVVRDKSWREHEAREQVSNYQQDNPSEHHGSDEKVYDAAAIQQISNAHEIVSEKSTVKSGASISRKSLVPIPESRINLSEIKISGTENEGTRAGATIQPPLLLDRSIKRIYRVGLNIFNMYEVFCYFVLIYVYKYRTKFFSLKTSISVAT